MKERGVGVKSRPLLETVTEEVEGTEAGVEQMTDVEETKVADMCVWSKEQMRSFENTKLVPEMVTEVDPVEGPESGEREVMATGAWKEKGTGEEK